MSDYVKQTNFGVKDSLASGNPKKLIRGSEFQTEFSNIETAVNSKADKLNAVLTGNTSAVNITATGATILTGATTLAGTLAGTFTIDGGTF
tara:strand:+ start:2418 stop:2690 length:273 start_codon:yes stop_codon:yes gene_type:complete